MFGRKKKASVGSTAAKGVLFDSDIRGAALSAIPPLGRLGYGVVKSLARQRARHRWSQVNRSLSSTASLVAAYAPQIAEELGLIPPPRKRRGRKFIGVAVVGAGAYYLLEPTHGAEHRQQLQRLVAR